MGDRLELDAILREIVNITEPDGDSHVYFNPPASVKMKYPAIRYKLKKIDKLFANNLPYKFKKCYELVVMELSPDGDLHKKVLMLPYCSYDRFYISDNIPHHVFTLYH